MKLKQTMINWLKPFSLFSLWSFRTNFLKSRFSSCLFSNNSIFFYKTQNVKKNTKKNHLKIPNFQNNSKFLKNSEFLKNSNFQKIKIKKKNIIFKNTQIVKTRHSRLPRASERCFHK